MFNCLTFDFDARFTTSLRVVTPPVRHHTAGTDPGRNEAETGANYESLGSRDPKDDPSLSTLESYESTGTETLPFLFLEFSLRLLAGRGQVA